MKWFKRLFYKDARVPINFSELAYQCENNVRYLNSHIRQLRAQIESLPSREKQKREKLEKSLKWLEDKLKEESFNKDNYWSKVSN